jgi:SAM-dependent methyltransferase
MKNNPIDYDHDLNLHTLDGPRAALSIILKESKPRTLLDVGCGTGTWLKAALELGIPEVFGVDGVGIAEEKLLIPRNCFCQQNLTEKWNLGRRFETAMCLEVAEHLDSKFAPILLDALVAHSDRIFFSAARPGQDGQHHVNCQWPSYWQKEFNDRGYVCSDDVRWQIWDDERVEPWYRQNIFLAVRDVQRAGSEPRLQSVIHPDKTLSGAPSRDEIVQQIEGGSEPFWWYLLLPLRAAGAKLRRKLFGARDSVTP